jgi:hypothetical protein
MVSSKKAQKIWKTLKPRHKVEMLHGQTGHAVTLNLFKVLQAVEDPRELNYVHGHSITFLKLNMALQHSS